MGRKTAILTVTLAALACGASAYTTADEFVAEARQRYRTAAYAGLKGTLSPTNAVSATAQLDRKPGLVRWLDAPNVRNVRDIGGWTGLRVGRAFRGTQIDARNGYALELTGPGRVALLESAKIRTELDLRRTREIGGLTESPLGKAVRFVHAPVEAYDGLLVTTNAYAKALRVFADERNYPVYFHCVGGADRTGMVAMLLEALCGVDEADIQIDYELTTFTGMFPRHRSFTPFVRAFGRVKAEPGRTLQEKADGFIRRVYGLTAEETAAIRRNLLPPPKPTPGRNARAGLPCGTERMP